MRPNQEALSAWRAMLEVHERLTAEMDGRLRTEHGLPLQWYDVLVQLSEAGEPLRMRDLAERTLFSRTECTRVVARMETGGLVAKHRDPEDGRGTYAELTPAGERMLREASRTHLADIERSFTTYLDEHESSVVADVLWRVATAARADGWNASDPQSRDAPDG